MLWKFQNKPLFILILLITVMLGFNLDVIPISIMEARNFITAREMITDGNWLLTTMNGEPRYQKPPLPSYICALFGMIFGINNIIAMRIPALIFIIITAKYTYLLSEKITKSKLQSFHNAIILMSSFYIIAIAFEAPSDIITHGFMMIGIYHFFILFNDNSNYFRHAIIAGFFIGCSILSKGPVSFYALLLPFLLAYGLTFKFKFSKKLILAFFSSLVLAIIIGSFWFIYVSLKDPDPFIALNERETSRWSYYNVRPFYYYWSFFVQSGIWTIPAFVSLIYPYLKSRVSDLKAYKFTLFWTLFAVILLSVIPVKKSRYLVPVLIPLAMNTGFYLEYIFERFKTIKDKREFIPIYGHFGLIALLALILPFALFFVLDTNISKVLWPFVLLSLSVFVIGVFMIVQLKKKNLRTSFYLNICFLAVLLCFGLPISEAVKSNNYSSISGLHKQMKAQELNIYAINYIAPEMLWEYGDKIPKLKKNDAIIFPSEKEFGLLTNRINAEDLELIKNTFCIKEQHFYDLNVSEKGSRAYNERLQNDFYILVRKK